MASLPESLGRYRPQALLGAGAMGIVYRAHDPLIDRPVAVKVMRTEVLDPDLREEFIGRFCAEARAAGRCAHPAIVSVYDVCDDPNLPFIVMEYVDGPTLAALMRAHRTDGVPALLSVLRPVLDALAVAHGFGIVHRDIKPANIMVTRSGEPKLADFGVARLPSMALTQTGGMLGTPSYMAPEQALGRAVDHRADLFALACVLHELLLGRPPFAGATLAETLLRLTGPDPARLDTLGDSPFLPVLRRGLEKDPDARFASAADFAAALHAALAPRAEPEAEGATVVLPMAAAVSPAASATWPGPVVIQPPGAGAAGFDPTLLARLGEELVVTLGPIAPSLVRRAAMRAATLKELHLHLAEHLPEGPERSAFLRRHWAESAAGSAAVSGTRSAATMAMAAGVALRLPEPALEAVGTALAYFVGPIARVLVRRAAATACSVDEFLDRLAGHMPKPEEAGPFRRRLRAELEQHLRGGALPPPERP